ncbi:tRNA (N6-threonylcarbamoyladenosine(37)-N6)-methyltransferase TrmO [Spiribacter vilamensis]|uniref:tRNA-Thr(GGU) m(6)t(6)A37 methyltransferase TsaA n=1 Tax=Spiribacter vilamensis TaxID=531306 RepID=A0A4Q8CZV4_9GAMM|nr:tRNA (N6-threonylcarbamoyladenosine(37)-N6)-methyltransferase TrmO [Spiribacter vilamensis]RZU98576.1 tRNA-Thr(GGU) m(6)t(6)A37 methyltransferase TsaA [Spiribacter vilamensis]TVO60164.1 tRNA (N6-threonylcarbamoyladenosine(37)-N6)-methyltransferase TrmO [Spiribacter vilamensis]
MDIQPIATVRSDFESRFGTPRQPGLVPEARAELILHAPFNDADALRGLDDCSHCWLVFGFHASVTRGWRPTVRPPRLGGNRRLGVFATRSPVRPNGLGLSLVRLAGLLEPPGRGLALRGADLMDGTPVFDIKPYLPAIEAPVDARAPEGLGSTAPGLAVEWSDAARTALGTAPAHLGALIEQTLAADPRPAYHASDGRRYGMRLLGYEVQWVMDAATARVTAITPVTTGPEDRR